MNKEYLSLDDENHIEELEKHWHFQIPLCACGGLGIKDKKGFYCASCKTKFYIKKANLDIENMKLLVNDIRNNRE